MTRVQKKNHANYFQNECTRVTVPMINDDDIKSAAIIFHNLAVDLEEIAKAPYRTTLKIMEARAEIMAASTQLKGGYKYKGRTT